MKRDVKRFCAAALTLLALFAPASAQVEWTPYENNPVIEPSFDIESQTTYRVSVIKNGGYYHLWYGKLWQDTRWVAYTRSSDGITWEDAYPGFDNAVLGPSSVVGRFDQFEASHATVVADGDTLKMWYSGTGNGESGIGYAWALATDGTSWTKVPGPLANNAVISPASDGAGADFITHPTVVKQGGMYHMWYVRLYQVNTPLGFVSRLAYARSADGLVWQVIAGAGVGGSVIDIGDQDTFDEFAILWPTALYNGDSFELWYQGLGSAQFDPVVPRVGCARSDDGITWQRFPDPLSEAGECFRSLAQPFVLLDDNVYKMWYALSALDPNDDVVMYATSEKTETSTEGNELPSFVGPVEIYPNPTSSQAHVKFALADPASIAVEIRDILGRLVRQVDLRRRVVGEQLTVWDGRDASGSAVPSGAYVVSIRNLESGARSSGGIVHVVR